VHASLVAAIANIDLQGLHGSAGDGGKVGLLKQRQRSVHGDKSRNGFDSQINRNAGVRQKRLIRYR
jgi:hypothetical protein